MLRSGFCFFFFPINECSVFSYILDIFVRRNCQMFSWKIMILCLNLEKYKKKCTNVKRYINGLYVDIVIVVIAVSLYFIFFFRQQHRSIYPFYLPKSLLFAYPHRRSWFSPKNIWTQLPLKAFARNQIKQKERSVKYKKKTIKTSNKCSDKKVYILRRDWIHIFL